MNNITNFDALGGYGSFPPAFGSEMPMNGPTITGKWINKQTGETVQVRDSVICDNDVSVMLSDGRMISMKDFSTNYYQISEDIYDASGNVIGKADDTMPPSYNPGTCPCPPKPGPAPKPVPPVPPCPPKPGPMPPCPPKPCPSPDDYDDIAKEKKHLEMVTDVFSKVKPEPNIDYTFEITGENFPKDQLQMLLDIFGVHLDDISLYLYRRFFTPENIMTKIKEYLEAQGLKEPESEDADKTDEDTDPDGTV